VRGERGGYVGRVEGQELGAKFGEVYFLRVGAAIGVCGDGSPWLSWMASRRNWRDGGGVPSRRTMVRVKF
jgi:hypothetical protein